jgi:multidrug efflux system outer membrane protein
MLSSQGKETFPPGKLRTHHPKCVPRSLDSLIAYQKSKEVTAQRQLLVTTLTDRSRLAYMRYTGGVSTLLEALDADRELFNAELSLAQARRDELLSDVQLYKALGGGWQQ